MALKGTLEDFGIADIFQLIGQQAKTGVLVLDDDVDEVRVEFKDGAVVRAANALRPAQVLLGTMMVRAGVIDGLQLDLALDAQQKSLKRLGAVLVDLGLATPAQVTEFATLQLAETVHQLFEWKAGKYSFEPGEVEPSPEGVQPLRAEAVVMNGLRMIDEWPGIRRRVPSLDWLVEPARPLPPLPPGVDPDDAGPEGIGAYERRLAALLTGDQDVRRVVELSRLGEFETARALANLAAAGHARLVAPRPGAAPSSSPAAGVVSVRARLPAVAARVAVTAASVAVALALAAAAFAPAAVPVDEVPVASRALEDRLATAQLAALRRALLLHRLEVGEFPDRLERLAERGLAAPGELKYPFERNYHYRRLPDGSYELLPPVR
jgi:hypothetical protein